MREVDPIYSETILDREKLKTRNTNFEKHKDGKLNREKKITPVLTPPPVY